MDLGFFPGKCGTVLRHVWHGLRRHVAHSPARPPAHPIHPAASLGVAKPVAAPSILGSSKLALVCKAAGIALGTAAGGTAVVGLGVGFGWVVSDAAPSLWSDFGTSPRSGPGAVFDVPEPSAGVLVAAGIAGLAVAHLLLRRRGRRSREKAPGIAAASVPGPAAASFDAGPGRP